MTKPARRAHRRVDAEANDRALLRAAHDVLAEDGAHASVAAIAARAGVGIGTLYRRYRTKSELFQHLCAVSLDQWLAAAEDGLAHDDPWEGLAHYVTTGVALGSGSLGPIAGMIEITEEMADKNTRSDAAAALLVERAHAAGVLRSDVTVIDLHLLLEQLGRSPLLEQLGRQGRPDLVEAARNSRARITAIALDGLRAPAPRPLPGAPPGYELFSERWEPPPPGT
ncbi:TetR family transcriptional regulator [Murinocardiopsis flavida]|uniref:TetR family transcriptional regulator n=1 Tax=Murinocardiopsis flavida TaxID=645275 RepID=A0A2P8DU55_9ACTN|nr:TetR family transcriptional regulator [Murinocardiopsis flavida]PSL00751.1 TetR family transcriptional regulator [Murinocardiopsis flavida]